MSKISSKGQKPLTFCKFLGKECNCTKLNDTECKNRQEQVNTKQPCYKNEKKKK